MAMVVRHTEKDAPLRQFEMTIVAQNPSVRYAKEQVRRAKVRVPDRLLAAVASDSQLGDPGCGSGRRSL